MVEELRLTLAMEPHSGDGEAAMDDEMVEALTCALIADLNSIETVRAYLLGVLQAEVSVASAIKVVRTGADGGVVCQPGAR